LQPEAGGAVSSGFAVGDAPPPFVTGWDCRLRHIDSTELSEPADDISACSGSAATSLWATLAATRAADSATGRPAAAAARASRHSGGASGCVFSASAVLTRKYFKQGHDNSCGKTISEKKVVQHVCVSFDRLRSPQSLFVQGCEHNRCALEHKVDQPTISSTTAMQANYLWRLG